MKDTCKHNVALGSSVSAKLNSSPENKLGSQAILSVSFNGSHDSVWYICICMIYQSRYTQCFPYEARRLIQAQYDSLTDE